MRSKLVRNDGLKYIFGVRVVDPKCADPDAFNSATKILSASPHHPAWGRLILNLTNVLSQDAESQVHLFENSIKQLMFLQYRENCKRETKKDIFDWYKPVFDSVHQSKESF